MHTLVVTFPIPHLLLLLGVTRAKSGEHLTLPPLCLASSSSLLKCVIKGPSDREQGSDEVSYVLFGPDMAIVVAIRMTMAATIGLGCFIERIWLHPDMIEVGMLDGHVAVAWACCVLCAPSPSPQGVWLVVLAPAARHVSIWLAPMRCKRLDLMSRPPISAILIG